jgi:hypothetical protein
MYGLKPVLFKLEPVPFKIENSNKAFSRMSHGVTVIAGMPVCGADDQAF